MSETTQARPDAVAGQVDRGVRPHAIRLASQLQNAAYSHGYEDGHPSNAITRQDKYGAASQRLLSELREAIERLIAERDAIKETLHNELDGNLRLRDMGGARPDECMSTFLERVFAERDQGRAALADVAMMLKVCAWALRRGTSPTIGERALVLLTKHGLMGSPLREGTRCTRLSADGEPCGLEPPCPDCGRACHDVPEGA